MKKTLITLMALGGVAMADDTLAIYDASILHMDNTSTKVDSLTSNRGQLWFKEDAATLSSWMIEFSLDKLGSGNTVLFSNSFGTTGQANERHGLSVYSWFNETGVTIGKDNSHFTGAVEIMFPDASKDSLPVTLRLAYDATADTAYLYCVETKQITSVETTVDYILKSATLGGTQDQNGVSSFWTDGGVHHFTVKDVTDMSPIAGNSGAFETYVKTLQVIPEPTTATLSLFALAGLAARRRRK